MAWARFDDKLRTHPKFLQLRKHLEAKVIWFEAIVACNEHTTDGVIAGYVLEPWAFQAGVTSERKITAAAAKLVDLGLWHDATTIEDCTDCWEATGPLQPDAFYIHDYLEYQQTEAEVKDPIEKKRGRRRKQLSRNIELTNAIRERDHDQCRYCGEHVNFRARQGDQSGTYDHINPMDFGSSARGDGDGGNALHKIVVACRRCNGVKKNRTPEEAGMPLRPLPSNETHVDRKTGELLAVSGPSLAASGPVLAPGQKRAMNHEPVLGRGQAPRAPAREAGRGQDGPRTGQGRARAGQTGSGSGRVGGGSGKAGTGRSGSGRGGPGKAGGGPSRGGSRPPPSRSDPPGPVELVEQAFTGTITEPRIENS